MIDIISFIAPIAGVIGLIFFGLCFIVTLIKFVFKKQRDKQTIKALGCGIIMLAVCMVLTNIDNDEKSSPNVSNSSTISNGKQETTQMTSSSKADEVKQHKQDVEEKLKKVDFDYINNDAAEYFKNSNTYNMVQDASFSIQERNGKKIVLMSAIVGDSISEQKLLSLADSMIRLYGSDVSFGTDLKGPERDFFCKQLAAYDIFIVISPASDPQNKTYLMKSIPAGAHTKIKLEPDEDFYK